MQGITLRRRNDHSDDLVDAVRRLKILKVEMDRAVTEHAEHQEQVLKMLEMAGRKSIVADDTKATAVTRPITKYDEQGLAKALGARAWNKITKKVLDKPKLEHAVEDGEIDINVVAQYATVTDAKPYVRLSAILEDDPDA